MRREGLKEWKSADSFRTAFYVTKDGSSLRHPATMAS